MNTLKTRNPYFDNIKLALIFLVILGHFTEHISFQIHSFRSLYTFIYAFHIPVFTLISGYFSKNISAIPIRMLKFLICYIVFELLYVSLFEGNYEFMVVPFWLLWFVFCLVLWSILLSVFSRSRLFLIAAFILAIGLGYIGSIGYKYSLSRAFVFFPFFLAGYFLKEEHFKKLKKPVVYFISAAVLTAAFIYSRYTDINIGWLYGSVSYKALGFTMWYAGTYRLLYYVVAFLLCFSFLGLIPEKRFFFTYMGENTLYAYLLHGFIVLWISKIGFYKDMGKIPRTFVTFGISILTTVVLLNIKPLIVTPALKLIKQLFKRKKKITIEKS